jgi:hypothetical protein
MDQLRHQTPAQPGNERKRFPWLAATLTAMLVMAFVGLSSPVIKRSPRAADRTEALNNVKQIGLPLFEFDYEYGKFPDASTISAVREKTKTDLDLGSSSSNQIFRQLIAAGLKSEKPFWCKSDWSKRKADNIYTPGKALQPGEVGFAYIAGLKSSDAYETPVIVAPLIPGTTRFDPVPFQGKAIVLRLDNSATAMAIDPKTGQVMQNGMDIFDPRQPFWKGEAPDIKWPETP